ncbi:MAG: ribosome silencing factor [Azospirillum sp.]|nr:ribosome silencing factor [Azospirillum sp.]
MFLLDEGYRAIATSFTTDGTAAAARPEPPSPTELKALVERSLDDDQAEDVVIIDLGGKTSFADYMAVASGRSNRHVGAMADNLCQRLKRAGIAEIGIEGMPHGDWVLVDAGDVVIHLFRPEVRSFYNLEKMWGGIGDDDSGSGLRLQA